MITWLWHAVVALWVGAFFGCLVWGLFSRCPAWLERFDADWRNEAEERAICQQADFVLWEVGQ